MNDPNDPRALLARYFDQQASPEELAELADQLATDARVADALVQLACLEVQLQTHFAGQQEDAAVEQLQRRIPLSSGAEPAPSAPPLSRLGSIITGSWRAQPLGTFALVTLLTWLVWGGFFLFFNGPHQGEPTPLAAPRRALQPVIARLGRTGGARWEKTATSLADGAFLRQGEKVALESGWAEVQFQSGTRVLLTGPVRFTLAAGNAAYLQRGMVWADVPEEARGFVIQTSQAAITDLGTEFAVAVEEADVLQVAVFEGRVEVAATESDAPPRLLVAGESFAMTPTGSQKMPTAPLALRQLRDQGGQLAARGVSFRLSWLSPGADDDSLGPFGDFEAGLNAGRNAPSITVNQITFADATSAAQSEGVTITSNAASVGEQTDAQPATSWRGNLARLMQTQEGSPHSGAFQVTVGGLKVGQGYRVVFLSAQDLALTGQRVMHIASGDAVSPEFDATSPKRGLCPLYLVEARFQATAAEQVFTLQSQSRSRAVLGGVAVFSLPSRP